MTESVAAAARDATPAASDGLSSAEALARLAESGSNELPTQRVVGWPRALARQLTDVVIIVLLVAAALTLAMRDNTDAAVILTVIVVNTLLGAGQEVRSSRALAALADLTAPQAAVVRDGAVVAVAAGAVVPGDLLVLTAGDIVAADGWIVAAEGLQLDESLLTGESLPVDRSPGETLAAATVVTRGRAEVRVERTGARTAIGRIGHDLRDIHEALTPLQRRLAVLGRGLAVTVAVVAALVAALNIGAGQGVEYSITIAISLAVAAIPESLPAVVTMSLALAARRMAANGVLVRRLAAVEALGSVTVLASDKTGTLTEGQMSLAAVWSPDGAEHDVLEAVVLCNDAGISAGSRDDPTEVALLAGARAAGVDDAAVRARYPRVAEEPFDAGLARMTTVHQTEDGGRYWVCKGSPAAVLARTGDDRQFSLTAERFATEGSRVLGVTTSRDGRTWRLAGLVALADPPRARARGLVSAFRAAGVRTVMITGDHPATALAVARAIGLDTDAPDTVNARVRPEQKTDIVRALQHNGELVAMTGDGVNDALALRAADVGVAVGGRATEVARQAADLVLTSDDLEPLERAIGEGRRAYDNLRRFLHYGLSGGLAEILVVLVGPVVGFAVPLQPGQILWVNLLTHGLPGVAMGNEAAEPDVMTRPPRPPRARLLDRITTLHVLALGTLIAVSCLAAGIWARHADRPWQSYVFLTLAFAQLAAALALRPRRTAHANPLLLAAVALNVLLAVLVVTWTPLGDLLNTDPLGAADIAVCALAAVPATLLARVQSRSAGRPTRSDSGTSTLAAPARRWRTGR